ncbi:ABC transporter permease subunit [Amphritea sp. 1_MG-2023]|uniref:ABC transporter permease n=1 Tax=Amphritea sp. 1_MG-2023 TaxID=3062670 RepID=UPI0026E2CC07|nr:ABC transporter permease subunit [Amphritea sp. 1_MG-2023]MDO6563550.1 ABC transporter permease subunit [Amphritea sp. 1_MG-2023]
MAFYDSMFSTLGLQDWCGITKQDGPMTMAQLLAKNKTASEADTSLWDMPFPSLDNLHAACNSIPRTRDMTNGVEQFFLSIKSSLQFVLDPLTQPLSWLLDGAIWLFVATPWWLLISLTIFAVYSVTRTKGAPLLVAITWLFLAFIDHYTYAVQTMAIIFICTGLSVIIGVPIGIAMSKYDRLQKSAIPVLDMLQTLPTFVYLIPLIFLFSVTESKLYGIAIILYAIVPVVRLTDLGIRLVDQDIIEAANAFGMTARQKLLNVELPLALPTIMAGVNQTIMMSLAMVVIASLVSAPGLGVLVLRGINNLELGVGLVSGFCIVILAILLDRVSKAALARVDVSHNNH